MISETDNLYDPPKGRNSPETDAKLPVEQFWKRTALVMLIVCVVAGISAVVTHVFHDIGWYTYGINGLSVAALIFVFVTNVVVTSFISARCLERAVLWINVVNIASWTIFVLSQYLCGLLFANSPPIIMDIQRDGLIISITGLACAVVSFPVTLIRWYFGRRR